MSRKAELDQVLADAEEPPPLLHPEMATFYREQVSALHEALQADPEAEQRYYAMLEQPAMAA